MGQCGQKHQDLKMDSCKNIHFQTVHWETFHPLFLPLSPIFRSLGMFVAPQNPARSLLDLCNAGLLVGHQPWVLSLGQP